jgi:hypothetical protein
MVWGNSTKIGCGYINYGAQNNHVLVCHYGPRSLGNVDTQPVYLRGEPCSRCPSDLPWCDAGLCIK